MIIQHNIAAANTIRQLTINKKNSEKDTERLSSGYRINRAADDAAGLSISEKLRNQIRGLNRAAKNIKEGISLVQTGDGGMSETHELLKRMRELAVQSANGVNTEEDRQHIQEEINQLVDEVDAISEGTEYNTIGILNSDHWPVKDAPVPTVSMSTLVYPTDIDTTTSYTYVRKGDVPPAEVVTSVTTTSTEFVTRFTAEEIPKFTMDDWTENGFPTTRTYGDKREDETRNVTTLTDTHANKNVTQQATTIDLDVSPTGYPQFRSTLDAIPLYCAMTRLDMQVGGSVINLYNHVKTNTVMSLDGKSAETVYAYDDLEITQVMSVTDTDGDGKEDNYNIQLTVNNTSAEKKDVNLKFAFDALNGYDSYSEDRGGSFNTPNNDNTTNAKSWTSPGTPDLEKVQVRFQDDQTGQERVVMTSAPQCGVGFTKPTEMVLDNIETLYSGWDYDPSQRSGRPHNAVGYYWDFPLEPGESTKVGCGYASAFSVDVYETTVKTTKDATAVVQTTDTRHNLTYDTELVIQAGANEGQIIKIPLLDTSAEMLEIDPLDVDTPERAGKAIGKIDKASAFISKLRGNWGARQNRLESALSIENTSENLQTAESIIRDADMAKEMMENSKHNILLQASQSVLTQANNSSNGVLNLLQ
jgi:flagellin